MRVFITGDRSLNPVIAVINVANQLGLVMQDLEDPRDLIVATGAFETGVDRAVEYLIPGVQRVEHTFADDGTPDLAKRDRLVNVEYDKVVFIHPDPLASKIGTSLVQNVEESKLTIVS